MIRDIAYIIFIIEGILAAAIIVCWLLHIAWLFLNRAKNEITWYMDYMRFKGEYKQWKAERRKEE